MCDLSFSVLVSVLPMLVHACQAEPFKDVCTVLGFTHSINLKNGWTKTGRTRWRTDVRIRVNLLHVSVTCEGCSVGAASPPSLLFSKIASSFLVLVDMNCHYG